jgi:hypothetical protein
MVVLFGVSWPASIIKSYRSRTTKGKSLAFLCLIFFGYIFGVASKLISGNIKYVVFFYILNTLMVGTDICLYFRNKRLDMQKGGQ